MITPHRDPVREREGIEGISPAEDASWGDYPLDTLLIRTEGRTVQDILRRVHQGLYVMDPEFQRNFIWDEVKQSKLIESVFMRIPLPVFYLAENDDGKMVVVDGLQRLSTFDNFLSGGLRLKLRERPELNGKLFSELSPKLQNRLEDCYLTLYLIDPKVPDRARLDIFERVNGGVPLTRQQMRNSLYMGQATRFLKDEARTPLFLDATGHSLSWRTMRDREFVNRFCGFQLLTVEEYRGEMDDFLADALKYMNSISPQALEQLSSELRIGLLNNLNVFGAHAFRKHTAYQSRRSVLNASLWDVMATGLSRIDPSLVVVRVDRLKTAFYELMRDGSFVTSITYGTNATRRVIDRFRVANEMFQGVFGDRANRTQVF